MELGNSFSQWFLTKGVLGHKEIDDVVNMTTKTA